MLTLRGRHLHTLRWMWHANRVCLPYHVIIADGEVHTTIDRLLSNPATFPNLSYEYHRHCDLTFSDYYKKLVATIQKIETKYVMMSDNDDLLILAGIQKSIAHLDNDPEYVCAGGEIPEFAVAPHPALPGKIIGQMVGMRFGYKNQRRDISFPSVSDRVMHEINQYQTIYYHVYRARSLQVIFEELVEHNFSDLTVAERYMALRSVTLGKIRTDPSSISYFRQKGTSSLSTYYKTDWVENLLYTNLPQDYRSLASAIASEVKRISGNDSSAFMKDILSGYAKDIRHMLAHTVMRHRFPRLFRFKQRLLWLQEVRVIPEWVQRGFERKRFWNKLSSYGADATLLGAYKEEFLGIETTLRGDGFLLFIKMNAPDLMNSRLGK